MRTALAEEEKGATRRRPRFAGADPLACAPPIYSAEQPSNPEHPSLRAPTYAWPPDECGAAAAEFLAGFSLDKTGSNKKVEDKDGCLHSSPFLLFFFLLHLFYFVSPVDEFDYIYI